MEIYQKAFDIIERYFGTEEEDKDVSDAEFVLFYNTILYRLSRPQTPISSLLAAEVTDNSPSKALTSRRQETRLSYSWAG